MCDATHESVHTAASRGLYPSAQLAAQDVDLHDAAHFRLSRTEATALDPQARLLLEVAAEVRAVGFRPPNLEALRAGAAVGFMLGLSTTRTSRDANLGLVSVQIGHARAFSPSCRVLRTLLSPQKLV